MAGESTIKIGGLLLAAGGSSRLGRPKQLLEFKGITLIRRAAETLVNSTCKPVVVVLGAEATGSRTEISSLDVGICVNDNWQAGIGSSIKAGLLRLLAVEPDLEAVMITLCDQPFVTSKNIDQFISAFRQTRAPTIAAKYGETTGVPALFSRELFDELLVLVGDKGARDLIRNSQDVVLINLNEAAIDIDTVADVDGLNSD